MEESIKKAEELIEETNATLARIQHDAAYDDFSLGIVGGKQYGDRNKGKKLGFNDMKYMLSPREKILETDEAFGLNKRHSIRDDKIDDINYKIEAYRLELFERESAKGLHFDCSESIPATRTTSDTNLSQKTVTKTKQTNLTEDLKSKLQQTREIVDRGIQTARELNETVEVLRSGRQPKTHRHDEPPLYKSEKSGRSESGSTIKTVERKRCRRCNAEITRKMVKGKERKKEDNVLLTRVTGMDSSSPRKKHKLNYQQLPSLKIQGGLSCQRIPSVDIPPGNREPPPHRVNTAYETYSHEEIIRGRIDKIVEDIKNSSGFAQSHNGKRTKSVECSNCGKVLRVNDKVVRTEQIDELLKICDYNVFDPRIDEFVGRFSGELEEEAKYTQMEVESHKPTEVLKEEEEEEEKESPKEEAKVRISDLSSELTRKYMEKATELESDHLEFESILRELFQKMDESRAFFKNCDYLNAISEVGKRKASLSVTPPVLLSYTGSGEEADDGRNAVLRPNRSQRAKLPPKLIRKKLEKKELEINCKLISSASPTKDKSKETTPKPTTSNLTAISEVETSLISREISKRDLVNRKSAKPPRDKPIKPKPPEIDAAESKPSPPPELVQVNLNAIEESAKQTNTLSDYESDFEEESLEVKSSEPQTDDNSYKYNTRLSTICEVESDLDRKMSDMVITPEKEKEPIQELQAVDEKVISPKRPSVSSDEDEDTRKLLQKVNEELREVASQQLISFKKSETIDKSSEVGEPLKEVLNALKNQFERTELLADRLTESIKEVKEVKKEEICFSDGHRDLMMVNNLRRARKDAENGKFLPSRPKPLRSLRGKSRKTWRENGSTHEDVRSLSPSGSASSKGSISTGKSYSEGEITEQEVLISDKSSPSIGEIIDENHSDGSLSEEKSVIKFT